MKFNFPKDFYWGTATSAHQVEGDNHNDWIEWEDRNCEVLADRAKKHWSEKQKKEFPQMFDCRNYKSGKATGHYNRFIEDFDILKSLNNNAYRFSIEWSRIEPQEGKFNEKEIEHYKLAIKELRKRNIEPFVTLWHFTNPIWINKIGGWKNKKTVGYFIRYAEKAVSVLGEDVKFWITVNEPEIFSSNSYLKGIWPPQKKNIFSYIKTLGNLIRAHRLAYKKIKKINPEFQVGVAKNNIYFEAYKNKLISLFLKKLADWWWNYFFLNRIRSFQDFIGLNYYFHNRIKGIKFNQNENNKISDLGWELYPEGIHHVLRGLKKYNKPIYITENGLADAKDKKRIEFIKEILINVSKAIREGIDIRGYFYWSLLDNFEWDKGFWPRFGLVEVDYQDLSRKIRPSALEYKKIIEANAIEV